MTAYATLAQVRNRLAGDVPVTQGSWDQEIVDAIAEVSDLFDEEVRNARGQGRGWSFLASQAYGVQLVSISPAGTATAGTFTLSFGAGTTAALAYGATTAAIQTAMNTLLGSGNSVVTGPTGGPWTITFAGTLSGPQQVLVATSGLTPSTTHALVEKLVTGSAATVTRRYTGTAGGSPLLLIDDCVSVSAVSILDPSGNVTQTLTAGTDYLLWPLNDSPITGLQMIHGRWPWGYPGGVSVTLRPGYGLTIPDNVSRGVQQEVIRNLRAAQAGEDDRLGVTQYGSVVVSKALLSSSLRIIGNYRFGAGYLRRAG